MEISQLDDSGLCGIRVTSITDERGSLTRYFDKIGELESFSTQQASVVFNSTSGILRGMHFQDPPSSESKLIFCLSGRVFDVVVDISSISSSNLKKFSFEIGPDCEFQGLFLPKGFAHGYLTLSEESLLLYFMDQSYDLELSRGFLWSDPVLDINWPKEPDTVSERDSSWPLIES